MTVAVSVSNTDCSQRIEHQFMVTHGMVIVAMQQNVLNISPMSTRPSPLWKPQINVLMIQSENTDILDTIPMPNVVMRKCFSDCIC